MKACYYYIYGFIIITSFTMVSAIMRQVSCRRLLWRLSSILALLLSFTIAYWSQPEEQKAPHRYYYCRLFAAARRHYLLYAVGRHFIYRIIYARR